MNAVNELDLINYYNNLFRKIINYEVEIVNKDIIRFIQIISKLLYL